ncbi:MAG: hypothetical protein NC827_05885 [Candidatus Omnitrophica bacterium]|nr:hypothetical protein [Candidatus Omnitrophota bacterium]
MEKVLVKLDYHLAKRTSAKTWWTLEDGTEPENLVYTTGDYSKTHWYRYYLLPSSITLIRHRISNRGNYSREYVKATDIIASINELPPEIQKRYFDINKR